MLIFRVKLIQDQTNFNICLFLLGYTGTQHPKGSLLVLFWISKVREVDFLVKPFAHQAISLDQYMYSSTYFMLFTELKVCWIDSVKQLDNPVKHKRIVNGPHRKKSNGCLHEFVVIAYSWKSCDLRCVFRYYVFFPLKIIGIQEMQLFIHS